MKKLIPKKKLWHINDFPDDIARMIKVMAERGYELSETNACVIWEEYSDSWAAGWLMLPLSDDELAKDILEFAEVEDEKM